MSQESTSKVKLKFSRKQIAAIIIIVAILPTIYLVRRYVWPIYTWQYAGRTVGFRANLRVAQNVPLITEFPKLDSDYVIWDYLVRNDVTNITFVFKPTDEKGNTLYILEETEIIKSLTFAYLFSTQEQKLPGFDAQAVDNYDNITATQSHPKIVLIHPDFGNQTSVRQSGFVVYVEAKNKNNFDSNKAEFDFAAVRLMLAILEIKIQ
jgi:hypothetical protein